MRSRWFNLESDLESVLHDLGALLFILLHIGFPLFANVTVFGDAAPPVLDEADAGDEQEAKQGKKQIPAKTHFRDVETHQESFRDADGLSAVGC